MPRSMTSFIFGAVQPGSFFQMLLSGLIEPLFRFRFVEVDVSHRGSKAFVPGQLLQRERVHCFCPPGQTRVSCVIDDKGSDLACSNRGRMLLVDA